MKMMKEFVLLGLWILSEIAAYTMGYKDGKWTAYSNIFDKINEKIKRMKSNDFENDDEDELVE
jgi:hypothetical protein